MFEKFTGYFKGRKKKEATPEERNEKRDDPLRPQMRVIRSDQNESIFKGLNEPMSQTCRMRKKILITLRVTQREMTSAEIFHIIDMNQNIYRPSFYATMHTLTKEKRIKKIKRGVFADVNL
jgi:hypothetical protein